MKSWMSRLAAAMAGSGILGCAAPKALAGVEPVHGFELERYLGTWHEVARLDHPFERGVEQVTATYSLREGGGVRVLNKAYRTEKRVWKQVEGKAFFVGEPSVGFLKVSFFGPFYGSYVIFDLDTADYGHAFVAGPSTSYLWLLSRTPTISDSLRARFISMAAARSFDTAALIWAQPVQ